MERTIKILLILLVVHTGCKVTRKVADSSVVKTSEQTEAVRTVKEVEDYKGAKDVNSELETTTVTTVREYFEPSANALSNTPSDAPEISAPDKGALMKETTTTTTTKKRDSDKSTVEVVTTGEATEAVKEHKEAEVIEEHKEVKKTGVATWKIVGGVVALLLVVVFLVKKNVIRIPFLVKLVKWIEGVLSHRGSKAA